MSYSQPAQPGRQVECKAIGTVSADRLAALQLLLQGMAGLPGVSLLQHCMVLKGPSRDKSTPELRLLHQLATAPAALASSKDKLLQGDRWLVRHEGLPLRGRGAADLPATVRSVTVAECSGQDLQAFWEGFGFKLVHELVQQGHRYVLKQAVQLEVFVAKIFGLEVRNDLDSKVELSPGHLYVEVTAQAVEGEHVAPCQAIGAFAETLASLCELRKP